MGDKVKLASLWRRTSERGTEYFAGFMGAARLVMLRDDAESAARGADVWALFAETPAPRQTPQEGRREAPSRRAAPSPTPRASRPSGGPQKRQSAKRGPKASASPPGPPLPADELPF